MGALSRATLLHDVGYLESGLQSALEGLVLGDEVAGYARALLAELPVDDEALALAEVEAVGPGGNHLGTKMTRRHFRDFWRAVADRPEHLRPLVRRRQPDAARARARPARRDPGGGAGLHPRRRDAADAGPAGVRPGLIRLGPAPRGSPGCVAAGEAAGAPPARSSSGRHLPIPVTAGTLVNGAARF